MMYIATKRIGTEKCLECGGTDISKFDGDYTLEYDSGRGLFTGTKRTGFNHPGCGGEIIASSNPVRLNIAFTPKYYDFNGLLITNRS